jgi:hypothetical protein
MGAAGLLVEQTDHVRCGDIAVPVGRQVIVLSTTE